MKEIEKKYKVKNLPNIELYEQKRILQYYLYMDCYTAIRKREIKENTKSTYFYTVKTKGNIQDKYTMNEIETQISKDEFEKLVVPENSNGIDKTRLLIPIENELVVELDIFHGVFEGIVIAEIEFPDESIVNHFIPPAWLGEELENKEFSNSKMAFMNHEEIKSRVKQFKMD